MAAKHVAPLDAPNPSQPGSYAVATLCYGSGTDRHRPEYGDKVDIRTQSVDATPFVANLSGFKAWARKKYWGFEPNSFPLNARVWCPQGDGPFPLVLIVHGNHKMEEFSDPGYAYLGELLASRGFIAASIDQNFLNGSWAGDLGEENDARGWLLLKHLELWRNWNEQEDSPFHDRVDLANIALIGHSRGGEAIVHATAFNALKHDPDDAKVLFEFGFSIRTLIAIAPIDGQYEPLGRPVPVENVNYLVLQGSHDSDLQFFAGSRCYRRVAFTDGQYWMKAALYIHRANHGQFNTVWGEDDVGPPLGTCSTKDRPVASPRLSVRSPKRTSRRFWKPPSAGGANMSPCSAITAAYRSGCPRPCTSAASRIRISPPSRILTNPSMSRRPRCPAAREREPPRRLWRHQEMKGRGGWPFPRPHRRDRVEHGGRTQQGSSRCPRLYDYAAGPAARGYAVGREDDPLLLSGRYVRNL